MRYIWLALGALLVVSGACGEDASETSATTGSGAGGGGAASGGSTGTGGVGGAGGEAGTAGSGGGELPPVDCTTTTCYFVRSDAAGTADGSDWTNAFTELPDELARGAVYLVADGSYPALYVFDDEVDGSELITVKKATVADHGVETGWEDGFGDGIAVLGPVEFHRSYYLLDGSVGGGRGSYRAGHGFVIPRPEGGFGLTVGAPWASAEERLLDRSQISIRHVEVYGSSPPAPCDTVGGGGLFIAGGTNGHSELTFSHLWLHDLAIQIQGAYAQHMVLEDSCLEHNASSAECHSEAWAAWGPSEHVVVRHNLFSDIEGTAYIALERADYWDVYDNVFTCTEGHPNGCGVGNGIVGTTDHDIEQCNYWNIHHNAFVNLAGLNAGLDLISTQVGIGEGNLAYNNVWFGNEVGISFAGIEHDYNWFFQNVDAATDAALVASEVHAELGSANPFVDWPNDDYHLTGPTQPGLTLAAPFDVDPDGKPRGADGSWDRGLYEFP